MNNYFGLMLQAFMILLLSFVSGFTFAYTLQSDGNEGDLIMLNQSLGLDDTMLEKQIHAMDKFITGHLTNKQLPPPQFNKSEFPDMNIFRQFYEVGQDRLKQVGICNACQVGIGYLMFKVRFLNSDLPELERVAFFVCQYFKIATPEVCNGIIERYAPVLYFVFKEQRALNSKAFCGTLLQSHGCTTNDLLLDWTVDIPPKLVPTPSIPLRHDESEKSSSGFTKRNNVNTGLIKIVQLADIHVDPLYEPGALAECDNKALCCHGSQGRPLNKSLQAGNFGDARKCDLPKHVFESALEHIAKEHADMQLFYMTGDLVPHNVWATSVENNNKIIKDSAETILKYLPHAKVVPVLGNHETHPVNLFSPYDVPEDISNVYLYNSSFDAFKQWIPEDQWDLYRQFGYYSMEINERFRLLVMNSNFCYELNAWQMYKPKDPGNQLEWLTKELHKSEKDSKLVHIVGHVPPGHEECYHVWSKNFYNIVKRYHQIIKAQFYGHTHFDEFKVIYKDNNAVNSMWIAPSLTPYEVHNVVYRVYYIDPEDYSTVDHETWAFDLEKENSDHTKNYTSPIEWFRHYTFTDAYGLPDARPESLNLLIEKLAKDDETFKLFLRFFHKSQQESHKHEKCGNYCKKRLLCTLVRPHTSYYEEQNPECNRIHTIIDTNSLPSISTSMTTHGLSL